MHYAVVGLRGVRMAVVLVERSRLAAEFAEPLIVQLQAQFRMGVMLVARDPAAVNGLRAYAQFDESPYLFALLAGENIEWEEVPVLAEPELPF